MTVSNVEIVLGIAAILLAMFHAKNLKSIALTISTRYLDKFPAYLSDLATLLARARREIVIFCDFPAYGRFSNLQAFTDYKIALEKKSVEGIQIKVTCLSRKQRAIAVEKQFAKDFGQKANDLVDKIDRFLKDYGTEEDDARSLAIARFVKLAEDANADMLRDVFHRHDFHEVNQPMHIFFWLIDGREAIFSIASHSEKALEQGFYTRDGRLIDALEEMRLRHQREHKEEENHSRH